MSATFSVKTRGANSEDIAKMMRDIGAKHARNANRRALRVAGNTLVDALQFTAPVVSGATKKALGIVPRKDDSIFIGIRENYVLKVKSKRKAWKLAKQGGLFASETEGGTFLATKQPSRYAGLVEKGYGRHKGWFTATYKAHGTRQRMIAGYMAAIRPEIQKEFAKIAAKKG